MEGRDFKATEAMERINQKDWYKVLGAKPSDSPAELKRKYQKLALLISKAIDQHNEMQYHPDKQEADVPAGEVQERVQRFIEIDQAWKILGNEETKKEYDLQQRVLRHEEFQALTGTASVPACASENSFGSILFVPLHHTRKGGVCFKQGLLEERPLVEDNLTKEWPLHAQIYLEDMSWNEDEQLYTLSCRCGGNYSVFKSETKDVSLITDDVTGSPKSDTHKDGFRAITLMQDLAPKLRH
ncbi:hypothetical protein IHE44_0006669 [Lamprotornis superbus]|uniref:J domain-containing protein n=1 Tax=Lamprotornis superbus TaxID=245042 RepID=A0A835TVZ4_9PASS|nr:hypothetical protein IHE44_0006669 [Lamprotornis superbus]